MANSDRQSQTSQGKQLLNVAWLGTVPYPAALALQDVLVNARRYDQIGDTLLLLEHPHVFTLGRGGDERFLLDPTAGVPIHRVSRGGQVTYHGPGQLVGYPILKLEGRDRDVHRYLRSLEQVIIDTLDKLAIAASRRDRLTGVWIGTRKIGSIGVGIRRWVTFHGFAVNLDPNLRYFDGIVPCGIDGCRMTSVAELVGSRFCEQSSLLGSGASNGPAEAFGRLLQGSFAAVLGYEAVNMLAAEEVWAWTNRLGEGSHPISTVVGDHHG